MYLWMFFYITTYIQAPLYNKLHSSTLSQSISTWASDIIVVGGEQKGIKSLQICQDSWPQESRCVEHIPHARAVDHAPLLTHIGRWNIQLKIVAIGRMPVLFLFTTKFTAETLYKSRLPMAKYVP